MWVAVTFAAIATLCYLSRIFWLFMHRPAYNQVEELLCFIGWISLGPLLYCGVQGVSILQFIPRFAPLFNLTPSINCSVSSWNCRRDGQSRGAELALLQRES